MDELYPQLLALLQIIVIDVVLAGDNAIVVGLAASRVAPELRAKVIIWGIAGAVVLRILFASVATHLLAILGLTLAGGILLLWVSWRMYCEIRFGGTHTPKTAHSLGAAANPEVVATMGFGAAVTQIVVADVSMSLDNVLAVAGAAKGNTMILIIGLSLSIILMAVAANYIARLLARHPSVTWVGLAIILLVAVEMIWRGSAEVIGFANASPEVRGVLQHVGIWTY